MPASTSLCPSRTGPCPQTSMGASKPRAARRGRRGSTTRVTGNQETPGREACDPPIVRGGTSSGPLTSAHRDVQLCAPHRVRPALLAIGIHQGESGDVVPDGRLGPIGRRGSDPAHPPEVVPTTQDAS